MKKFPKLLLAVFLIFNLVSCSTDDGSNEDNPNENKDEVNETEDPEVPEVINSVVNVHGQLSISGSNIIDKNGSPIQLRGMSLFWSQWSEGAAFYNAKTVKWLKDDWHATVVRAAMGVEEDNTGYIYDPNTEKEKVFTVIDAAIAEGIYVIVDWHSHHAEDYLEESKAFFTEVAKKYGDYPNIIYEIYNEPLNVDWTKVLKPYHEAVVSEIRKHDSNNIIVCGTRNWSQAVSEVIGNEVNDDNIAYTLHYYSSTHLQNGWVWKQAQKAIDAGIPLFVTEYGVTNANGDGNISTTQAGNWWAFLDTHKISWCNWSITNKNEASAALESGTSASNLSVDNLTTSGKMVYNEMVDKNQDFE